MKKKSRDYNKPKINTDYKSYIDEYTSFIEENYPSIDIPTFVNSLTQELPVTFRINNQSFLSKYVDGVLEEFVKEGFLRVKEIGLRKEGMNDKLDLKIYEIQTSFATKKELKKMPSYKKLHNYITSLSELGTIYRQETVSMLPVSIFKKFLHSKGQSSKKLHTIDICASPGSKSLQLLEISDLLISNDLKRSRVNILINNVARYFRTFKVLGEDLDNIEIDNTDIDNTDIDNNINVGVVDLRGLNKQRTIKKGLVLEKEVNSKEVNNNELNSKENTEELNNNQPNTGEMKKEKNIFKTKLEIPLKQPKFLVPPSPIATSYDARYFPLNVGTNIDLILCDVPCSGEGTVRKNKDVITAKLNGYVFTTLQISIFERCIKILHHNRKPNVASNVSEIGESMPSDVIASIKSKLCADKQYILYSTCSLSVFENELVVSTVLSRNENLKLVDLFDDVISEEMTMHGVSASNSNLSSLEDENADIISKGGVFHKGLRSYKADVNIKNFDKNLLTYPGVKAAEEGFRIEFEDERMSRCLRVFPKVAGECDVGGFFVAIIEVGSAAIETKQIEKFSAAEKNLNKKLCVLTTSETLNSLHAFPTKFLDCLLPKTEFAGIKNLKRFDSANCVHKTAEYTNELIRENNISGNLCIKEIKSDLYRTKGTYNYSSKYLISTGLLEKIIRKNCNVKDLLCDSVYLRNLLKKNAKLGESDFNFIEKFLGNNFGDFEDFKEKLAILSANINCSNENEVLTILSEVVKMGAINLYSENGICVGVRVSGKVEIYYNDSDCEVFKQLLNLD